METDVIEAIQSLGLNLSTPWWRYVFAFCVILLCLVLKKMFDIYLSTLLVKLTQKTKFRYDELTIKAINPPISAFFLVVGFYLAINFLNLPAEPVDIRMIALESFRIAIAVILVWAAFRLTDVFAVFLSDTLAHQDDVIRLQFIPLLKKALRIFVVIVGTLLIVQNLGYSVGSLIAGLGIGGLAVALAAQESLANFFGSIVLLSDRPFKVGDWIEVDGISGNLEELGFRSTRIRTWSKSLVTVPNKVLANANVENWSAMPIRRVMHSVGLTYDTPVAKMQAYLKGVRQIIETHPEVDQTFKMVAFNEFGASSLDILVYYFTASTKWAEHLAVREDINLKLMALAEQVGVSFAFPSRSLYWGPGQKPSDTSH